MRPLRELCDGIGCISDPYSFGLYQHAAGVCRGMDDREKCEFQPENVNRCIFINGVPREVKEPEDPPAIMHYPGRRIHPGHLLDAVELAKSHEVIVMAMCPEHGIDMR